MRHGVPLNFRLLQERIRQFNGEELTQEQFLEKLRERIAGADIRQVKADVLPFVKRPGELDIWSSDYFLRLASLVQFQG